MKISYKSASRTMVLEGTLQLMVYPTHCAGIISPPSLRVDHPTFSWTRALTGIPLFLDMLHLFARNLNYELGNSSPECAQINFYSLVLVMPLEPHQSNLIPFLGNIFALKVFEKFFSLHFTRQKKNCMLFILLIDDFI